jgi:hypothetical protein
MTPGARVCINKTVVNMSSQRFLNKRLEFWRNFFSDKIFKILLLKKFVNVNCLIIMKKVTKTFR